MRDDEETLHSNMNFHRKWALAIVIVTAGVYALIRLPELGFSPLGVLAALLLLIAMLTLIIGAGVALFTKPAQTSDRTWTAERFLPAVVLVLSLGVMSMLMRQDSRDAALAFAVEHRREFTGPAPQSVVYSEGIPDGGTAIIASPGRNPMAYPTHVRFKLTNGNMTSCEPLDEQFWLCQFG